MWLVAVRLSTSQPSPSWVLALFLKVPAAHSLPAPIVLMVLARMPLTSLARVRLSSRTVLTLPVVRAMGRQLEFIVNVTPPLGRANYPRKIMSVLILVLAVPVMVTLVFRRMEIPL